MRMLVNIQYGSETVPLRVPGGDICTVVEPADVNSVGYEIQPLPFAPELVIVNDASRPTPTAEILDSIYEQIPGSALFLVATGTHRPPTETELEIIFGRHLEHIRDRIRIHNARDNETLREVGITAHGTKVILNRLCTELNRILVIGSVEPHYFAGYTGGRKAFLPGTAAYRSIEENHRHALDPGSQPLALKGNPVHEDTMNALILMGPKAIYSIQAVLDRKQQIYAVESGGIVESFHAAVKKAEEVYVASVKEKADIVVAVAGPPLDANLYQAHKAIENTKAVLKDRGIMILVAECGEGIGNDAFVRLLGESETKADVLAAVEAGYKLGFHKASKLAELMMKSELWVVSSIPGPVLENIFMVPFADLQTAVDQAIEAKGKDSRVLVVQDACVTVPVIDRILFR